MMTQKTVLLFGSGHLIFRMKKVFHEQGIKVIQCTDDQINNVTVSGSVIDNLKKFLAGILLPEIDMIFLLDDKDEDNLQLIIALRQLHCPVPVTASLFNENFTAGMFSMKNKLIILNPAKLAAEAFVKALFDKSNARPVVPRPHTRELRIKKGDSVVSKLVLALVVLSLGSVIYFHYADQMSWIDASYFVVVIITTVGFGDINLLSSGEVSKIVGILLMLGSSVLIWMIFSLMIDHFLKNRIQLALGRRKYHLKNHVIVCGLGRPGYFIVEELIRRKQKVIIIEITQSEHTDYFRSIGAEVYIGDARSEKVLAEVNITESAALISVINNDALNIEIGLHARALFPELKIILRIFDEDIAREIKSMMNIHLALSNSSIASKHFLRALHEYGK